MYKDYEIAIIGSQKSGKTSLCSRLCHDLWTDYTIPTVNLELYRLYFDGKKINIWDTWSMNDLEEYLCANKDLTIILFNASNLKDYEYARNLVSKLKQDKKLMLVANFMDQVDTNATVMHVALNDIRLFAKSHKIPFYKVSTKTNKGIDFLLDEIKSYAGASCRIRNIFKCNIL